MYKINKFEIYIYIFIFFRFLDISNIILDRKIEQK